MELSLMQTGFAFFFIPFCHPLWISHVLFQQTLCSFQVLAAATCLLNYNLLFSGAIAFTGLALHSHFLCLHDHLLLFRKQRHFITEFLAFTLHFTYKSLSVAIAALSSPYCQLSFSLPSSRRASWDQELGQNMTFIVGTWHEYGKPQDCPYWAGIPKFQHSFAPAHSADCPTRQWVLMSYQTLYPNMGREIEVLKSPYLRMS